MTDHKMSRYVARGVAPAIDNIGCTNNFPSYFTLHVSGLQTYSEYGGGGGGRAAVFLPYCYRGWSPLYYIVH